MLDIRLSSRSLRPLLAALVPLLLLACSPAEEPTAGGPAAPPEGAPRLLLFVTVDQVRGDQFDRFAPLLQGGFARLLDEGVRFTDAHHFHSETVTATGHATLATGRLPKNHGVIGNGWYRRELGEEVPAVYDEEFGRSPRQLLAPTLGDVLKLLYPQSKVFGIGAKDRSAMFTAGLQADGAFFYDRETGGFRSSGFYMEELPAWLAEFNGRGYLDRYFGRPWEPLHSVEELADYDVVPVDWGWFDRQFPHPIGGPSLYPGESFYSAIYGTPFVDEYVGELAKTLIEAEGLGQDEWPDVLAVNFSSTDSVGHEYGPNSPEYVDTFVRADRTLAGLLNYLDRTIGLEHVLISLSADHGGDAVPELLAERGLTAGRIGREEIGCFQQAGAALSERFGPEPWFEYGLYLDRERIGDKGVPPAEIKAAATELLRDCPGVAALHDGQTLTEKSELTEMEQLYLNSYHPERSPDLLLQPEEHVLFSSSVAASHGSPYRYDTWVPWVVRLPDARAGVVTERVHTIDVAATLGPYLGLQLEGKVDGVDRRALLESAEMPEPTPELIETSAGF